MLLSFLCQGKVAATNSPSEQEQKRGVLLDTLKIVQSESHYVDHGLVQYRAVDHKILGVT